MSIEAMKQALEALECLFGIPEQFTGKGGGDVAVWALGGSYRAQQAIPALRQAIEQAESITQITQDHYSNQNEPVAWVNWCAATGKRSVSFECESELASQPLYTTPQPQREWVGLTQQDIDIAFDDTQEGGGFNEFAEAIEAKLKEKNA
jgi:hypothetical protein